MNGWLGMAWLVLLIAAATWFGTTVLVAVIARLADLSAIAPAVRARRALLLAAMPVAAPLTSVTAVCLLAAAKPLGWIADHCAYHGPGHPHLCFEHLPAIVVSPWHIGLFSVALLAVVMIAARFALRERRFAQRLHALACMGRGRRVRVIDSRQAFAFAANTGGPVVMLSRGLIESLTPRERRIVLAHEAVHLRNGDIAWNRAFELLLLLHPSFIAARLRNAWRQALEEHADETTAARYGRDDVASTLAKMLRLVSGGQPAAFAATGADPLRRIRRLVEGASSIPAKPWFEIILATTLFSVMIVVNTAHHALETMLGHLTGA